MKSDMLCELVESVKKQNLHVLNVIVRQHGEILARKDFEEERPIHLWSASKTITSLAVGIAISEGYFYLNSHVIDFFADYNYDKENEYIKELTIHDLLCMGSGHEECPVMKADWDSGEAFDIAELFFNEPFKFKPGTHFTYDNSATYMLSKLITITTGKNIDEYLNEKLFKYMDIEKPEWEKCPRGIPRGFAGLHLCASELSKIGQLILDGGAWNGKQLVPKEYIEKSCSKQISTSDFKADFATIDNLAGYGYQMWMNSYKGSCRIDGLYGQYVVIIPDKDAVVTYVSNEPEKMLNILELTWDTLIKKL